MRMSLVSLESYLLLHARTEPYTAGNFPIKATLCPNLFWDSAPVDAQDHIRNKGGM
jgi:hypothetical protein